jgi:hypothetical protein
MKKSTTAPASGTLARTDDSPRRTQVPRRPAQPVSAARPQVGASEGRPEAPLRTSALPWGGYTLGSGIGGGFMLGSGN